MKRSKDRPKRFEEARERYRDFCQDFPGAPYEFDGHFRDLDALDYCEYEMGGIIDGDIELAALIWSNCLVSNSCAEWRISKDGGFHLGGTPSGGGVRAFFFDPVSRMTEVFEGGYSQFDLVAVLTELFAVEVVARGMAGISDIRPLLRYIRNRRWGEGFSTLPDLERLVGVLNRYTMKDRTRRRS